MRTPCRARPILVGLGLGLLLVGTAGCGASRRSYEDYIPSRDVARRALETALRAWQQGQAMARLTETGLAPVQPVDAAWKLGHRLRGYEILGEVHGDSPRCFAVRLSLDGPPEEETVRYYVLGIQPLWVMRQEDYDSMCHWECAQDAPPTAAASSESRIR